MTLEKAQSMLLNVFNGYESEIAREVRESLEAQQAAQLEVEEVVDARST